MFMFLFIGVSVGALLYVLHSIEESRRAWAFEEREYLAVLRDMSRSKHKATANLAKQRLMARGAYEDNGHSQSSDAHQGG
jgi:hypothetical protein